MKAITVHVLEDIPFDVDGNVLMQRLHVTESSAGAVELQHLLEDARDLARPKALFFEACITGRGHDWVDIEGHRFTSRVLSVNLEPVQRVFPFLCTCGQELQAWADGFEDMLLRYWAAAINEAALFCAHHKMECEIERIYQPGKTVVMNPGSLQDWPIQEQRVLFDLFGDYASLIGVRLGESFLMSPIKSVSGMRFSKEADFESCMLCPLIDCPTRRAPYEPDLFERQYAL